MGERIPRLGKPCTNRDGSCEGLWGKYSECFGPGNVHLCASIEQSIMSSTCSLRELGHRLVLQTLALLNGAYTGGTSLNHKSMLWRVVICWASITR